MTQGGQREPMATGVAATDRRGQHGDDESSA